MTLEEGKTYNVRLVYNGMKGCTLGWNAPGDLFVEPETYLAAAKVADVVLYFAGLNHAFDRESEDRVDMKLPGSQDHVIEQLIAANRKTVVNVIAGSAVEMPWIEDNQRRALGMVRRHVRWRCLRRHPLRRRGPVRKDADHSSEER